MNRACWLRIGVCIQVSSNVLKILLLDVAGRCPRQPGAFFFLKLMFMGVSFVAPGHLFVVVTCTGCFHDCRICVLWFFERMSYLESRALSLLYTAQNHKQARPGQPRFSDGLLLLNGFIQEPMTATQTNHKNQLEHKASNYIYIYKNRHLGLAARASHMFDKVCLCRASVSANCCKSCSITFMFWYVFCWCLVKFAFVFLCLISRFYLRTKNKIYISQKPRIKHKYRQRVNRPKHYTNTNLTAHDVLLSHLKLAPWTCFMFCLRLVYIPFVCGCQDLKVSSQGHKFLDMRNVSAT